MSEIKRGDLVRIAYAMPCCGENPNYGTIFVVSSVFHKDVSHCAYCYQKFNHVTCATGKSDGLPTRVSRLIKIDPPAQTKQTETHKEITA
jgi:hypothetical protein